MKFAHLNARSVLTSLSEISTLILTHDFDVLTLTETWLSSGLNSDILHIPGYVFVRKDREGRGGGVAAYIRQTFKHQIISIGQQVSGDTEYLIIELKVGSRRIVIATFYRPPHFNLSSFVNDVDIIFDSISPAADEILCLGDMNVDFLGPEGPLTTCLGSYGLRQFLNEPTRITRSTSSLIDPIFFTREDLVTEVGTVDTSDISDHRLVYVKLNLKCVKMKPKFIKYRDFRGFDLIDFRRTLENLPWHRLIAEDDIDKKIDIFNCLILEIFDKHAPLIERRVTKPPAPWLTYNLKLLMKQRDTALQKFKRTRSSGDWELYKQIRNCTVSMIRIEKKKYFELISAQHNPSKSWKALRDLKVCSLNVTNLPTSLSDPDAIGNHFSSLSNANNNYCASKIQFYNEHSHSSNTYSFSLTTVEQIESILNGMRSNAVGVDEISLQMIQYCGPFIVKYIVHIINVCIESCYFPHLWKVSLGKPIPKVRNPSSFSDLRIISILPFLSKIFEKVLHNQMIHHLRSSNILPDSQCGFRKNYSTATALAAVTGDIMEAYDEGLSSILVLLDYSKAFDTINHELLIAKMKYYGFDLTSLQLIRSYLSNRTQYISSNNTLSSPTKILAGVPQGSVLGPLLFITYTADIMRSITHCKLLAYADDFQLYYHFPKESYEEASRVINNILHLVQELSTVHNLVLNPEKSKVMCFANKYTASFLKSNMYIELNNHRLEFTDVAKNLGLIMDTDLRFSEHLKTLLMRAYSNLRLIYPNRHILDMKTKRTLCESLVLSQFTYCDFIYGPCLTKINRDRIQKVQKSCFRFIHGVKKYDPISYKIREDESLFMESRRNYHLGTFTHKLLCNAEAPPFLRKRFVRHSNVHSRVTRFQDKFVVPRHKTALFQRSFIFQSITFYNSLPNEFKLLNINKFKYKVKKYLLCEQ